MMCASMQEENNALFRNGLGFIKFDSIFDSNNIFNFDITILLYVTSEKLKLGI